ncbi:MAG: N-6 DNA methylase [Deltaproteobacteria bacterium]|jgi:type I restriction-modification system DNA methylase subunit|nr:N-6 DNA methylase [Deltaproteobacteria bacterium]
MTLLWAEIESRAISFSKRWETAHNEEAQAQRFVTDLLKVFGVDNPEINGGFEYKVQLTHDTTGYIDYLWKKNIAMEMKSKGKDLEHAYLQLKNYILNLPVEDIPDIWLVCDFENMWLYRRSTNQKWKFKTKYLHKYIKRFANIAGYATEHIREDLIEVNVKAAEKMALLHDQLKSHGYETHDLEIYLVRLLFCLFAEHTGIFPEGNFYKYLENSKPDGSDFSFRIEQLFRVLNLSEEARISHTLLSDELKSFKYINGNLFKDVLHLADFDAKMRKLLLDCASFDWSKISPAIFGAMFQGVMDKQMRREHGAHYTSEENIFKLINPLFMDELWNEFEHVKTSPKALNQFHDKISKLKFLDPACGCGNFLIIAYRELRRLELEVLKMENTSYVQTLDIHLKLKVGVEQFYGIELEEFPCQIAQVGMWLMDHQMNMLVSEEFGHYYARLPLTKSATIICGNALRMDWNDIIANSELSYILGNPPFIGYSNQNSKQKEDIQLVCKLGKVDYVAAWYFKAIKFIKNTQIKCAFVSTNSITQGEQVAAIWNPLIAQGGHINFGVPTFKWSNEAKGKAAVHCIIVGFSLIQSEPNINPYLIEAPNILIEKRCKPICDVPNMVWGNKPVDGGNLILDLEEKHALISQNPLAEKYIKRLYGAEEFINNIERYCLWLIDANPLELRQIPQIMDRVSKVKQFRLSSKKYATQRFANYPTRFMEIRQPDKDYILIPSVSSENRIYIPMGFVTPDIIVSNAVHIIPDATYYHFGILTSIVHMAWVRAICGRLKSDYRYSKDIVYNNFLWPKTTDKQKLEIETAAKTILAVRKLFPNNSLADLYDPLTMPEDLLKAHQNLDRYVLKAYKFEIKELSEAKIVAKLMELYKSVST